MAQEPPTQDAEELGRLQAFPQPPQLAVLAFVLTSQPLAALLSQFA